jgi:hypothetical protein
MIAPIPSLPKGLIVMTITTHNQPKIRNETSATLLFLLGWLLVTAFCWGLLFWGSLTAYSRFGGYSALMVYLLVGLLLSFAQAYLLGQRIGYSTLWVIPNTLAFVAGWTFFFASSIRQATTFPIYPVMLGVGLVTGAGMMLILRRRVLDAYWWVVYAAVHWVLVWFLSTQPLIYNLAGGLAMLIARPLQLNQLQFQNVAFTVYVALQGGLVSLLVALPVLLTEPLDEDELSDQD